MNRIFYRVAALAVALPLALGACADEGVEDDDLEFEAEAPAPATEPVTPTGPMAIQLEPMDGSSVTGEASATHMGDQVMVDVTLQNLTEGEDYEAIIVRGTCPMGGIATEEADEVADLDLEIMGMTATATTTLAAEELPQNQDAYIAVKGANGDIVACGDIRGHEGMDMGTDTPDAGGDDAGTVRD